MSSNIFDQLAQRSALAGKGISATEVAQQTGTGPLTGGQITPDEMAAIAQWGAEESSRGPRSGRCAVPAAA